MKWVREYYSYICLCNCNVSVYFDLKHKVISFIRLLVYIDGVKVRVVLITSVINV